MMILMEWLFFYKRGNDGGGKKFWSWIVIIGSLMLLIPSYLFFDVSSVLLHRHIPSSSHAFETITNGTYLITQISVIITYIKTLFLKANLTKSIGTA